MKTVEECVIETQTGFQRRRREQQIDRTVLPWRAQALNEIVLSEGKRP